MSALHWSLDNAHTEIGFSVRHMMFSKVRGRFTGWTAELSLDKDSLLQTGVKVTIDVSSIDTANEQRDAHLRSGDFFNAETFPSITFQSTGIVSKGADFLVDGELTIRDVTRPVQLRASLVGEGQDPWGNQRLGFAISTKLNRKEFGLTWNQALETGGVLVGEDILIDIEAQAVGSAA
jgi:polyisoprenoid-binding protein YceI